MSPVVMSTKGLSEHILPSDQGDNSAQSDIASQNPQVSSPHMIVTVGFGEIF